MRASIVLPVTALSLLHLPLFTVAQGCFGFEFNNICCQGRVIGESSGNNGAGLICCVGDPDHGLQVGPNDTTCSVGTPTPLTALASSTGGATATSTSVVAMTTSESSLLTSSTALTGSSTTSASAEKTSVSTAGAAVATQWLAAAMVAAGGFAAVL